MPAASERSRGHLLVAALGAALVALPFAVVTVPPITDLPQQVAQMRLLGEVLAGDGAAYRVQWAHPNKLGYLPLLIGWLTASPLAAGRVAMALVGIAWVLALSALARATGRPPAAAALAALFYFNHITYWGFVTFLVGLPVFALWLLLLRRQPPRPGWRALAALAAGALLLYTAHVLWLAAGLAWLLLEGLVWRRGARAWAGRLAAALPALVLVAWWYPRFAASGFDSPTTWGPGPLQRLHPDWLVGSALGGLRGPTTALLLALAAAWLALGLWQHRRRLGAAVDRPLLLAGALFAVAALGLPSVRQHTIFFASRWLPVAAALLALALPPPRLRPWLRPALPLALLAALSLATCAAWLGFERDELDGFPAALAALPPAPRLLGLDLVRRSPRLHDFPYYHLYAYGQVLRGGTLARSFADQASSLVVFRDLPKVYPWTRDLDWQARRVRASDVVHFSHVLIFGGEDVHALFARDPKLVPVTGGAPWRLYAVRP